jgi:hypothetical protein
LSWLSFFSGGWISTRASGMKKNLYGNIGREKIYSAKIVFSKIPKFVTIYNSFHFIYLLL